MARRFGSLHCLPASSRLHCVLLPVASAGPGATFRASVATGGGEGNGRSFVPAVSADGRFVAFYSDASNLVAGDENASRDVFVNDRQTGETTRMSVDSSGAEANDDSFAPVISADGRFVAFSSAASNLVAGDTNGLDDIFVRDRQAGTTTRVSVAPAARPGERREHDALDQRRRALRRLPLGRDEPRRRRHERESRCLRLRPSGRNDDEGEREQRRRRGECRQQHPGAQRRRALRRVHDLRRQPHPGGPERELRRVRPRPPGAGRRRA